jgi:anaerobic selenocysteine-containing dehydrogenase
MEAAYRGEIDALYSLGGNLLETMPDRTMMQQALSRVPLRIHQDIVLNTSSLLPGQTVLILPAQTRYETPGGGTATNTERRIRFTPEIPGPRIAEALPEWQIPVRVALAARPELKPHLEWAGPADIRQEMVQVMPLYAGVERLERENQWVQWGGERLFTDGFTRMPGGRARFTPVPLPEIAIPPGHFYLTTRRGKQFNSMTYGDKDYLMGSSDRRDVLMNPNDAERIGVRDGEPVRLHNDTGEWIGVARLAPMKERHLQTYWPETNVLIPRRFDPVSGEPDYNAFVIAEPTQALPGTRPAPVEEPAQPVAQPSTEPAMARR